MNWDAIGAIGQVLGSIAVFITLAYLSVQVRHARQETRRLLSQRRSEALRDLMTRECDERISRISVKAETALGAPVSRFHSALMERAGLTPEEAWVMASVQSSYWNYYQQFIPSMDELPPTERTQLEGWMRRRYGPPGVHRVYYETFIRRNAHPDAVRYVDNLLAQPS